jgi:drug/metabolite transporter (DMT)-like permease
MMIRGLFYGLLAAAIWGGMYVVSDVVLKTIPPFTLLSIRLILASLLFAGVAMRRLRAQPLAPRAWLALVGVGLVGFGVSVGAQFVGTDKSTAINGSLITSASPAFILVFAVLLLGEKLTRQRGLAIVLATLGVLLIVNPAEAEFGSETFLGDVALGVAAVSWGLYSVLVRRVSAGQDTLTVTFFAFLGGMLLVLPASMFELVDRPIGQIDLPIVLGVLYLGVMSTAVATWLWNRAFALLEASLASLCFFAQPLVGAFLSVALLGQEMTAVLWGGSALIVAGVLLVLLEREKVVAPKSQSAYD